MARGNADWLMGFMHHNLQGKTGTYRGGRYTVGYWTMTIHAGFGRITEALPSGRKNGESFASGITPVSGSAPEFPLPQLCGRAGPSENHQRPGPESEVYSPRPPRSGLLPTPLKPTSATGGLQVQFNIIDRETLKDMVQHPG